MPASRLFFQKRQGLSISSWFDAQAAVGVVFGPDRFVQGAFSLTVSFRNSGLWCPQICKKFVPF